MVFTMSATAPEFLPEHESEERETLSQEEIDEIEGDINGVVEFEETPVMNTKGLVELETALKAIKDIKKRAYKEACDKNPELVKKESDPMAFLRCERYNAEVAAIRLVEYWKQRKALFGAEKAFQPMTMKGALSEDLEVLLKGFLMILPSNAVGKAVLFFDGAPSQSLPRNSVLRVWFYLLHLATRDEIVQKNGFIIINSIKGFDVSKHFDRMLGKKSFELVKKAMPAQLRASHACLGLSMPAIQLVAPASKQMAGKHIRLRAVSHSGSNQEMLDSMSNYDLYSKNLCHHLGGEFTQERFLEWIEEQKLKEEASEE